MTLEFVVPGMACGACAETITKAITAIDATAQVEADPPSKRVKVTTTAAAAVLKEAIAAAGYPVE